MTTSDGGLIRTVVRALGALAADPPPGSLPLNAILVLEPNDGAIAVDRRLTGDLQSLSPRLARQGRRLLHLPRLDTWLARGTAVLPEAAAAVGISLEALNVRWPPGPGDDDLTSGEIAIVRFIYAGRPAPESRADGLADLVWMLRDPSGRLHRTSALQLAALTARVPIQGVLPQDRRRLAAALDL